MDVNELDYDLPDRLIAQFPLPGRDESRLMHYERGSRRIRHAYFSMLPEYLNSGDLLVFNESRVMKARVLFERKSGGKMEIFFLSHVDEGKGGSDAKTWECLLRPSRKVNSGDPIEITEGLLVRPIDCLGSGRWIVECECDGTVYERLEQAGRIPLPPYIKRGERNSFPDEERYQTVYAKVPGSVAAPTAGLHFTEKLIGAIVERGVHVAKVSLNIGYGTFSPIRKERVEDHEMHVEYFSIPPESADLIEKQRKSGAKVIAIGTSTVRALETAFRGDATPGVYAGYSDLFIYPGYRFRMIDGLITNFHLPRSSLIALVMAFCGVRELKRCYREAISENYRFFSYGDAMFVV
ncbi:MAG: tRNA preQ1(34) S-adenosylmethionine ribosyltransferase-isomerase QueA [Deltaproteobacteria bacterium]|nr:tRNA preQ1(34) S-adenosylmethionine ribosyltransferase-isomerase QueA [Deltaproteobacteria bacterium]NIS76588.1 tRNA preQ1(34) S-adenosylmethionine ribosyltransferase-isomerase QueA [Deltaproteobacteria bacterium]